MLPSNYHFTNVHIRLREGQPPRIYHPRRVIDNWTPTFNSSASGRMGYGSGNDMLLKEIDRLRNRKLHYGM
ncbi:unnamed protein product [Protopolystoma xenopodis]|uniref:Uncharacterized protein n=1 Tax=Protopolystoma xenopodis TaxID=117903 RepID=A0A3S5CK96_9PLAT|nr:unnamed protein product [Protopolystoma xenopodis]